MMVVSSSGPTVIMTSILEPMIASPRTKVGSSGGAAAVVGHGASRIPAAAASRTNTPIEMARAPRLLWNIAIGIRPPGFIMYMIMKTAMIAISMTIMSTVTTPR